MLVYRNNRLEFKTQLTQPTGPSLNIAVLIAGSPRFCREFDTLIHNLSNHNVDWYFYLWKTSTSPDKQGMNLVAPKWRNINYDWALSKLQSNLPKNHNVFLELGDIDSVKIPHITNNITETFIQFTWPMFESLYRVYQLFQSSNKTYDLVIRARNDVAFYKQTNYYYLKDVLDKNPSYVFTNKYYRFGKYATTLNDFFAISSAENIKIYCETALHLLEYHNMGYVFHPESMLVVHLIKSKLQITYVDFCLQLRSMGSYINNAYQSDFGRWV